ncbi:MAG: hypothetical protein IPH07_09520 [Deltaproteobacteria bacterium]|nr:hypothetical protein [Deltaproteobacteria bacterium]MBP7290878.1 hypothetical protein [Nannocystaceae bacterium]
MERSVTSAEPAPVAVRPWLRGGFWDTTVLAYGWVPFYLWCVFGLGLGREGWGLPALPRGAHRSAFATAVVIALAITYVHRHYTFILVYGDRRSFAARARAYVGAPVVVFGLVALARASIDTRVFGVSPWLVVAVITGAWNVWHTLQQRYGIGRIYAAKLDAIRGPRPTVASGRLDRLLLWSLALLTACVLLVLRTSSFGGHRSARDLLRVLAPVLRPPLGSLWLGLVAVLTVIVAVRWVRADVAGVARPSLLLPRWSFVGSTVALLAVFVVHGPIVGYLCFGTAHAIEYVGFVHHFAARKYERERGSVAAAVFASLWRAPLPVAVLLLAFWLARDVRDEAIYVVYYISTSLLHFLFDGWIWKVRAPEVRQPLLRARGS